MEQLSAQRAPVYVVRHTGIDNVLKEGDPVPPGTYDDEQLARLVGLGAIEPVDPMKLERPAQTETPDLADVPKSAEEFKARQDAAALAAAGGEAPANDDESSSTGSRSRRSRESS